MIAAAEVKEAQEGKKKGQTGRGMLGGGLWGGETILGGTGGIGKGSMGQPGRWKGKACML